MVILDSKPDARILDATASNRSIWRTKESNKIIWIDIEPELEINPDLILDCTQTGFPDNSIMMLIFDPPHWWGQKTGSHWDWMEKGKPILGVDFHHTISTKCGCQGLMNEFLAAVLKYVALLSMYFVPLLWGLRKETE